MQIEVSQAVKMPTRMVNTRLDEALIARLEAHRDRLAASMPGLAPTVSDAIRMLLTAALDAAEAAQTEAPKAPAKPKRPK